MMESGIDVEDDDNDEHQLNIDETHEQNTTIDDHDEQSSDDEQVSDKKNVPFSLSIDVVRYRSKIFEKKTNIKKV